MESPRYVVRATVQGVPGLLCTRPYPRADHLDPFTYATREEAQAFADHMAERFPGNAYQVEASA